MSQLDTPAKRLEYTHACLASLLTSKSNDQPNPEIPSLDGQNVTSNKHFFYTANDACDLHVVNCTSCHDLLGESEVQWIRCRQSFIPLCYQCT